MTAKIYFTDMRAKKNLNLFDKVEKLCDKLKIAEFLKPKDLVAVKLHFGEKGNTGYIRPQFIRRVINKIEQAGAKPFLTDANTLYVGSRSNAVDHLKTAIENGFAYSVVGAPLVIADGLNGKDYVTVQINQKHFKEVKIGSAAYHADALIAVTHFKGHELTGFGGVLKNIGMGLGCRSAKQMMHSDVLPSVKKDKCTGCRRCSHWCPAGAISYPDKKAYIDKNKCMGCGECTVTCTEQAIKINWKTEPDIIQEKIVEYVYGVLKDKKDKAFFITFLNNVTPECDCCDYSDAPIVRDIGILASTDPVALDQACIDLVNGEKGLPGTRLGDKLDTRDKFGAIFPNIDWRRQLAYGEQLGLGTRDYELVKVE